MSAARKPQDPAKFDRFRARMKARGLRQVRLWVYDTAAPGFRDEMARQAGALRGAPEERDALAFIEAAGDFGDGDTGPQGRPV